MTGPPSLLTPLHSWTPSLDNYSNEASRVMRLAAYYANFKSLYIAVCGHWLCAAVIAGN